jgi:hypothetical protein
MVRGLSRSLSEGRLSGVPWYSCTGPQRPTPCVATRDAPPYHTYNTGLFLTSALDANHTLEANGEEPDWLGDRTSDSAAAAGQRNTRHDDGNVAWFNAVREALSTPVALCVKGNRRDAAAWQRALERYAHFNAGHVPDWGAKGAAASGRHLVGEHKCYSPLVPSTLGTGSRGGMAKVGDHVALGNTEEALIARVLGLAQRGLASEPKFNHRTGVGYVPELEGDYHDAIHVKGNTVLLLISEVFGGVNGTSLRFLNRLAHLMKGETDAPHFDRAGNVVPFFLHHARAISRAAAVGHGTVLLKHAHALARRAHRLRAGSGAEPAMRPPPPRVPSRWLAAAEMAEAAGDAAVTTAPLPTAAAAPMPAAAVCTRHAAGGSDAARATLAMHATCEACAIAPAGGLAAAARGPRPALARGDGRACCHRHHAPPCARPPC